MKSPKQIYQVTVLNTETNESHTLDLEGFVMLGLHGTQSDDGQNGLVTSSLIQNLSPDEITSMVDNLEKHEIMLMGRFIEKTVDLMREAKGGNDDCKCDKCQAIRDRKKRSEAATAEGVH